MKKTNLLLPLVVVLLAITLPYGVALLAAGPDSVFTGFLLNPPDGASYLAKMYEGWQGAWRFTLPYTAQPGSGAYVYLYYLFLGHLARWLGLSLLLTYHLARLVGAGLLVLALQRFYDRVFAGRPDLHRTALWLTAIGSGMGWLLLPMGLAQPPSDFWVAEAYPFLSMFCNAHFPLGLALVVFSFNLLLVPAAAEVRGPSLLPNETGKLPRTAPNARYRAALLLLLGLLTALVFPFALVVALPVALAWLAWTWLETCSWDPRHAQWGHLLRLSWPVICLGALGGPYLLYQFWAIQADPVLAAWNAQNNTPSPPVWDFVLALSPALILAPFGLVQVLRACQDPDRRPAYRLLVTWLGLGLVLIYLPTSFQRRFMLGFYIPTAALAVLGVDFLRQKYARRSRLLVPELFALALPTNLLLMVICLFGVMSHSTLYYLSGDEARALSWIRDQTPPETVVLASPEMGSLIPAYTGRRVIYGHSFETPNAAEELARVQAFFSQPAKITPGSGWPAERGVDYIFYGPRERLLADAAAVSAGANASANPSAKAGEGAQGGAGSAGNSSNAGSALDLSALPVAYQSGQVWVYSLRKAP